MIEHYKIYSMMARWNAGCGRTSWMLETQKDCHGGRTRLMVWLFLFCYGITSHCFGQANSESQIQTLYESSQWFALRDAVEHMQAPLFYRAATEYAFNQIKPAQRDLDSVIQAAPHSNNARDARGMLVNLYFRNGLYREAYLQLEATLAEDPNAEGVNNASSMLRALSQSNQIILKRKASTLPMFMKQEGVFIPVSLDGHEAHYSLDSGANLSLMSESEARRLRLEVRSTDSQMGSVTAQSIGVHIAVVKKLVIGGLHLENVAFTVLPDAEEPFVELPEGERGILGIPVLIAMQTVRWGQKGAFSLGFRPMPRSLSASNLAFDGISPVTQVAVQSKKLEFSLDTGETHSILYAPFAKDFPDLMKSSTRKESHKVTGLVGSANYDSVILPSVTLTLGGLDTRLAPAPVLLQNSSDKSSVFPGNLGRDLLNQAQTITLDFNAMTLRLR
jgi:Aspartyl protease